jgi:hypothetical protein
VTTPDPDPGWCPGYGNNRPPHWVDHRIPTSTGLPMCKPCALAWIRDDHPEETPR